MSNSDLPDSELWRHRHLSWSAAVASFWMIFVFVWWFLLAYCTTDNSTLGILMFAWVTVLVLATVGAGRLLDRRVGAPRRTFRVIGRSLASAVVLLLLSLPLVLAFLPPVPVGGCR